MPVKKTVKKTPAAKKPVAKKVISKATPKTVSKPAVIVETKKTERTHSNSNNKKTIKFIILALLLLNLIFSVINFAKKDGALEIEELKVGGADNFKKVMELYNSDFYKEQQTSSIQQFVGQ